MPAYQIWRDSGTGRGGWCRKGREAPGDTLIHEFDAPVNPEAQMVFDTWVAAGRPDTWPPAKPEEVQVRVEWGRTDECHQCEEKIGEECFTARLPHNRHRMVFCCSPECRDAVEVMDSIANEAEDKERARLVQKAIDTFKCPNCGAADVFTCPC